MEVVFVAGTSVQAQISGTVFKHGSDAVGDGLYLLQWHPAALRGEPVHALQHSAHSLGTETHGDLPARRESGKWHLRDR